MKILASCKVNAPKAKCFEVFSDLENLSKWVTAIQNIELLTDNKIGKGTRFKETRIMFGKESSEVMEITLFEPADHFREEASSDGLHYISDWRFLEVDEHTVVTVTFTIEARTIMAKLMRIGFLLIRSSLKKAFLTDMEEMKKAIGAN
jgi:carbon monoxide dehydrogenase subunit G